MSSRITKHAEYPIIDSMLKVFSLLKFEFDIKDDLLVDLCIRCINCHKIVHCDVTEDVSVDIIPLLSKLWCFIVLVFLG